MRADTIPGTRHCYRTWLVQRSVETAGHGTDMGIDWHAGSSVDADCAHVAPGIATKLQTANCKQAGYLCKI
jgi:hypothetical protein